MQSLSHLVLNHIPKTSSDRWMKFFIAMPKHLRCYMSIPLIDLDEYSVLSSHDFTKVELIALCRKLKSQLAPSIMRELTTNKQLVIESLLLNHQLNSKTLEEHDLKQTDVDRFISERILSWKDVDVFDLEDLVGVASSKSIIAIMQSDKVSIIDKMQLVQKYRPDRADTTDFLNLCQELKIPLSRLNTCCLTREQSLIYLDDRYENLRPHSLRLKTSERDVLEAIGRKITIIVADNKYRYQIESIMSYINWPMIDSHLIHIDLLPEAFLRTMIRAYSNKSLPRCIVHHVCNHIDKQLIKLMISCHNKLQHLNNNEVLMLKLILDKEDVESLNMFL